MSTLAEVQSCMDGIETVFMEPTTMGFHKKPPSSRTLRTSPLSDDSSNTSIRVIGKASDVMSRPRRRPKPSGYQKLKEGSNKTTENQSNIASPPPLAPDVANAWIQMSTPPAQQQQPLRTGPLGFKKTTSKMSQSKSALQYLQDMSPKSSSHHPRASSSCWLFRKHKPVGPKNPDQRVRNSAPERTARPKKITPSTSNKHNYYAQQAPQQQAQRGSFPSQQEENSSTRRRVVRKSGMKSFSRRQHQKSKWKTAVDPKTGRTYYYHSDTRATQWDKPLELASKEERIEMERKERRQRDFFAAMEANILKNLSQGANFGNSSTTPDAVPPTKRTAQPDKNLSRPNLVRTISTMEEGVLRDLIQRVPSCHSSERSTYSPTEVTTSRLATVQEWRQPSFGTLLSDLPEENSFSNATFSSAFDESTFELGISDEESKALQKLAEITDEMTHVESEVNLCGLDLLSETDEEAEQESDEDKQANEDLNRNMNALQLQDSGQKTTPRPAMDARPQSQRPLKSLEKPARMVTRRNTCSTLYVGSTMSAPDKDATIKCVCGVYRAHILQSEMEGQISSDEYRIFNDLESQQKPQGSSTTSWTTTTTTTRPPTLEDVTSFYRDVFRRAQMESDCIIMSLIYVERLIKCTEGALRPTPSNWRSILFSCMVLSSKVWDDLSMWNADFSQTCPAGVKFSLKRINEVEVAVLSALNYKVKVPASEYAKYYFLLRSMLIKSGLGGDDLRTMNPLDVEGAKRLQQVSTQYQTKTAKPALAEYRSKSMGVADRTKAIATKSPLLETKGKVSLEHVVQM